MRALLAPAAALLALAGPVALTPQASAESTTLKAVIFEEVKPLYQKTDAGYEGLGVDVLEQIRIQAKRRKVDYRGPKSVNNGIGAVITGKADIACGVAFTWGRSTQVTYSLPFGIGGTRLLMANDTTVDGTPASLEGQTIGVVKDTASAQVLKNVVPGATLKYEALRVTPDCLSKAVREPRTHLNFYPMVINNDRSKFLRMSSCAL